MRLEVASLSLRRAERTVLEAVSFHVSAAEILGVIGPNGAGKSTLLEAVAGLHPGASGEVRVEDCPLAAFRERAAAMALMPDGAELPEEATVAEVLGARAAGDAASALGVSNLLAARAGRLSRGEAKRVLLAAASPARRCSIGSCCRRCSRGSRGPARSRRRLDAPRSHSDGAFCESGSLDLG